MNSWELSYKRLSCVCITIQISSALQALKVLKILVRKDKVVRKLDKIHKNNIILVLLEEWPQSRRVIETGAWRLKHHQNHLV